MSEDNMGGFFGSDIIDYGLIFWTEASVQVNALMVDLFLTNTQLFASQDIMDWSHVDYLWIIVMFLTTVWTLILTAPIHCRLEDPLVSK